MNTIRDIIGDSMEESYLDFDLSEVQEVLQALQVETAVDLPQAENMQRLALRAAEVLSNYIGRMVKTLGYLEAKLNRVSNKAALEYEAPKGKTTADMRRAASESSPEVEEVSIELAKAKATKSVLEKRYDIVIKAHHFYKDISNGFKRTIVGVERNDGWN